MWAQRRQGKYNATSQQYNGRTYHSKKEAAFAQELDLLLQAGEIIEIIPQFKVSIDINGYHICNYFPDFMVTYKDGSQEIFEVKGFFTEIYRLKRKLMEATYLVDNPGIKFTEIT